MQNASRPPPSSPLARRRLWGAAALLDVYPVRMMLALSASLGVVLLAVHLPLHGPSMAVGWQSAPSSLEPLTLQDVVEERDEERSGVPITMFGGEDEGLEGEDEDEAPAQDEAPLPEPPPMARLQSRQAALEFSEVQPQIRGGLGAYYIHIDYPQAAREAGIQGRLVLAFVVEKDGSASGVTLLQPLHPLLDSSAVHALRRTRFIPGEHEGKPVRVKMKLPVRFQLVNRTDSEAETVAERQDPAGEES